MKAVVWRDETLGAEYDVTEIPADLVEKAKEYREKMIEAISEFDDKLFEKFIEGHARLERRNSRRHPQGDHRAEDLPGDLRHGLQEQGRADDARRGGGLPALAARCSADRGRGRRRSGEDHLIRHASDKEPFSALVFKIMTDPYVGQLAFFRVYSGTLKSGDSVYNVAKRRKERIGRLLRMHANKREEIQEILAGDICAAVGLKTVSTGDTICDDEHPIVLESIDFPTPVIQLAVEPKTKADQEKLGMAIQKLAQEDPTFQVNTDPETGQTILSGMGELHLEIIVDRMMREFGVGANVGKPQVAYRETIRKSAEAEGRHVKQSGGRGQYGVVKIKVEPLPTGGGFEFVNDIYGGTIPKEFIKPIEAGIKEALEGGILAGFPMSDVKVTLFDGSYHDVDSSEMAFKIAGSLAIKEAARKAKPVLLEPIMAVEVVVPEQYMGDVIGDLNSRRGRIEGMQLARHDPDHQVDGAAVGNVRLRDRCALPHAGPRQLHHALWQIRGSSRRYRRRDRKQDPGQDYEIRRLVLSYGKRKI